MKSITMLLGLVGCIAGFFLSTEIIFAQSFSAKTDFPTGSEPYSAAVGDFNGDGMIDMAVANYSSATVSVLLNTTVPGATTPSFSAKADFTTGNNPRFISIGDFNGDGMIDMAVANLGSNTVSVFLNTTAPGATTPSFSAKTDFTTGGYPASVSIGDFNRDGRIDMAVANYNFNTVSVFLNTTTPGAATPSFSAKTDFTTGTNPASVSIADFNGDGMIDMVVANFTDNTVSVLLNTTAPGATTPAFSAKTDFTTGTNPISVSIGDFNGDGRNDMTVANYNSSTVSVLLNTTVPGATTPSFSAKADFTTGNYLASVSTGDFNGDGKSDMAAVNYNSNTVSIFLNTTTPGATTPSFSAKVDFATGSYPYSVSVGDFNGDGKNDMTVTNRNSNTISVLLNTTPMGASSVTFSTKTDFATAANPFSVAVGDFNGDGKLDLVTANLGSNTVSVLLNTTTPGATTPTFSTKTDFTTGGSVAVGDFNGDGKLDLVTTNSSPNTVSVLLNTTTLGATTPTFSTKTDFTTGGSPRYIAIGDINGDGKLDIVTANGNGYPVSILLNTTTPGATTPTFSTKTDFITVPDPYSIAIGDFNGDGKLDLVTANYGSNSVSVLLNTTTPGATTPTFSTKTDFAVDGFPCSTAIEDFNGDGKLDIAVTSLNSMGVSILLNTTTPGATTPTFSTRTYCAAGDEPCSIAIGDFNGDGKLDLVTANNGSNTVSVLLNTTTPGATISTFSTKTDFMTGSFPVSVAIGDFNGDGKLDLVTANNGSNTVSVFLNNTDFPLPVELVLLAARATGSNAELRWNTATEVNNYGFEIERRTVGSDQWMKIGFVKGAGTSNSPKEYSYTDTKLVAGRYVYRLKQVDNDGTFSYSQSVEVEVGGVPNEFSLFQNYPNPFNPSTVIQFDLPDRGQQHAVSLQIFDLLGREVATLLNEKMQAGPHQVTWNASNMPSGVYLYRLQAGTFTETKKLTLLK